MAAWINSMETVADGNDDDQKEFQELKRELKNAIITHDDYDAKADRVAKRLTVTCH